MTTADQPIRPQHDAPPCPACSLTVATPAAVRLALPFRFVFLHGLRELWCPACGHMWSEENDEAVAKAWWAGGAYAGAEDAATRGADHTICDGVAPFMSRALARTLGVDEETPWAMLLHKVTERGKWARVWTSSLFDNSDTCREDFAAATREEAEVATRTWLASLPAVELANMGQVAVVQVVDELLVDPADFIAAAQKREAEKAHAEMCARDEADERAEYERLRAKFG